MIGQAYSGYAFLPFPRRGHAPVVAVTSILLTGQGKDLILKRGEKDTGIDVGFRPVYNVCVWVFTQSPIPDLRVGVVYAVRRLWVCGTFAMQVINNSRGSIAMTSKKRYTYAATGQACTHLDIGI